MSGESDVGSDVISTAGEASFDQYDSDTENYDSAQSNNDDFDEENNSVSLWDESGMEQLIDTTLGLIGNADITFCSVPR